MPVHIQVPFVCVDGEEVEVDKGMVPILSELKRHGVKTLYSCEGDHDYEWEDDRSYVLIRARTFWPLAKKIIKGYRNKSYSEDVMGLLSEFVNGLHELYFGLYKNEGTYRLWSTMFRHNARWSDNHSELSIGNHYGIRVCFRWREYNNEMVLKLLRET